MTNSDYWVEAVEQSLDEVGIVATSKQIADIARDIQIGHEQFEMAFGYDVASQNLQSSKDREIATLRKTLRLEQEKITCKECNGQGTVTISGPCHVASSRCWKCNGQGRL